MPQPGPLVSVIVPAHGVAAWIDEAVGSALNQTMSDVEVIVINDGSPDTPDLERALAPFMGRIVYLTQPNAGVAAARNAGLRVARGEWVAFLDGDDVWDSRFLESQLAFAAAHGLDMAWSDGWLIGDTPNAGERVIARQYRHGPLSLRGLLSGTMSVATSATIVRADVLRAQGGFDERLHRAQDFELWVRLMVAGVRASYNPLPLMRYRVRSGSLSGNSTSQLERTIAVLKHIDSCVALPEADQGVLRHRLAELEALSELAVGKELIVERQYVDAARRIRSANQVLHSYKLQMVLLGLALAPAVARWCYLRSISAPAA